jgi:hypothetical protein
MKKIKVPYSGKEFSFTYYSTTINTENIYFVQTSDKHAAKLLVEDHFFITLDIRSEGGYFFNAIQGGEREVAFKEAIAIAILRNQLRPAAMGK